MDAFIKNTCYPPLQYTQGEEIFETTTPDDDLLIGRRSIQGRNILSGRLYDQQRDARVIFLPWNTVLSSEDDIEVTLNRGDYPCTLKNIAKEKRKTSRLACAPRSVPFSQVILNRMFRPADPGAEIAR